MLQFVDRTSSRRDFLRIGGLGLGGISLGQLLAAQAAAAPGESFLRDKSVIFLFMHGGPPQAETFDPKMTAPAGVRSVTGECATSIPGVTYGGTLPKLAEHAHRLAVVRSFQTGDGNHDIKPIVGRDSSGANLGSLYARLAGANHPRTGMPRNALLLPRAVDPDAGPGVTSFGRFDSSGELGSAFAPFVPGAEGEAQQNLQLNIARDRLDDRRHLLSRLDQLKKWVDQTDVLASLDRSQQQAFSTILGGVAEAFDLSKEDPRLVSRYDTKGLIPRDRISKRWNNHRHYADHVATLGKLLLQARRLCEAGCGFVTVTTSFVWDMHADINNATMEEGMAYCGHPFDHAVSAFIEDVESRGLRDKILLVCCGEMGRTPTVNAKGGRDHWGELAPLLLYGGGLRMGQVIGQSDSRAAAPATEPIRIPQLISTLMHTLLDVSQLRLATGIPSDVERAILGADPIGALI
jgi:hypothetical protein